MSAWTRAPVTLPFKRRDSNTQFSCSSSMQLTRRGRTWSQKMDPLPRSTSLRQKWKRAEHRLGCNRWRARCTTPPSDQELASFSVLPEVVALSVSPDAVLGQSANCRQMVVLSELHERVKRRRGEREWRRWWWCPFGTC